MSIIDIALREVGTKESPAGSNIVKYNDWFYNKVGHPGAWCGTFVSWVFDQNKTPLGTIDYLRGYASVPFAYHYWVKTGETIIKPSPGDIVLFDWNRDGLSDHTGIFYRDLGSGLFEAIEGNTGIGNDSNGGEVMIRRRNYNQVQAFIHPKVLNKVA